MLSQALYIYLCVRNVILEIRSYKLTFRQDNKKNVSENSKRFSVAVYFNYLSRLLGNLRCVDLKSNFQATADGLICY